MSSQFRVLPSFCDESRYIDNFTEREVTDCIDDGEGEFHHDMFEIVEHRDCLILHKCVYVI